MPVNYKKEEKMLRAYLKSKYMTQKEFAARLRISKSYMSMLVNRKRIPSAKIAQKIYRATGRKVKIMWLLFGK